MKVRELAASLGASWVAGSAFGPESELESCAALGAAGAGDVSFFADGRHKEALSKTGAAAVILEEASLALLDKRPFAAIVHSNPAAAFAVALEELHAPPPVDAGAHSSAVVEPDAVVHESASVLALSFVGAGARIGAGTVLMPGAHVGPQAVVGEDCWLGPGSVLANGCSLGDRVRLQARAVIGSDGFGYALDRDENGRPFHRKVLQVGVVRVEDDVEVGAGATIDRATTGETVIGRGTKIDNLVQVGHNCVIGPMCVLCGQVGLAGSTRLGTGVVLGGQAGIAGHLIMGDGAKAAAQSGVHGDVPEGETVSGTPAIPHRTWLRAALALKDLPALLKRVRRLEKKLGP